MKSHLNLFLNNFLKFHLNFCLNNFYKDIRIIGKFSVKYYFKVWNIVTKKNQMTNWRQIYLFNQHTTSIDIKYKILYLHKIVKLLYNYKLAR